MFHVQPHPTSDDQITLLRVRNDSQPTKLAGAIAGVIREGRTAELQAVGAGAVNQAVKAIAIARSYLEENDVDVCMIPRFVDVVIGGSERTAMVLTVEPRHPHATYIPRTGL